jgi:hypothetical protein
MTLTTDITTLLREQGSDFLLSSSAANVMFPVAVQTRADALLGHSKMGTPVKHDSIHIRFSAQEPTKGVAKAVDINARAYEVDKQKMATEVFGALVTKETYSFDHQFLSHINAAQNKCATDAQYELIGNSVLNAMNTLADRYTMLVEKTFWQGVGGEMSIDTANGSAPLTVPTGTVQLPVLAGTDVWSDTVNADPLKDIDAARSAFRGTGFSPKYIVMNQVTYEAFVNTDSVKAELGEALRSAIVMGLDLPTVRGMALQVYDEGYIDDNGTFQNYVPDGVVVFEGVSPVAQAVQRFDCINVDDTTGATYGSFLEVLTDKNPVQKAVYHSWVGAPVFVSPQAFVTQTVF